MACIQDTYAMQSVLYESRCTVSFKFIFWLEYNVLTFAEEKTVSSL